MATFRDLIVWQKSMVLVTSIYKATENFPITEQYNLTSQIKRSSISIPSNIAEGYGRNGTKDFLKFLNISLSYKYNLK